jgi:outer membrane protein OmpA-like peptidoglycan-associated protein
MNRPRGRLASLVILALLVAGCATRSTVVLLPEKDGRETAVSVRQEGRETVLDRPYAAARVRTGDVEGYTSNPDEVARKFGAALAAQPAGAQRFVLFFVEGKDEFTDESKRIVDDVLADIAKRPVPDVVVVGHTDAVGSDPVNDALGQRRADLVRSALIQRGVPPDDILAISRGKRAPAVPTPDGVAEPRNRRVEIVVR